MSERFEVEEKFPLNDTEPAKLEERLRELGFAFCGERTQYDHFIPGTRKGELLRVRVEGTQYWQTVKETVRIGDKVTRRESEPAIHPIAARFIIDGAKRALRANVPSMYKRRRDFKRAWNDFEVNVVLDYVPELDPLYSSYFMEVEIIVEDPAQVEEAKALVGQIAEELFGEMREPTKLSYRRMLFKTLRQRGAFPKRWNRLAGHATQDLTNVPVGGAEGKKEKKSKKKSKKGKKRGKKGGKDGRKKK